MLLRLVLLCLVLAACGSRPNIVVLLTDDQRHDTLDVMPNVQRLAAEGVRFREAITPIAVCGPARVALLTGRLASTQGLHVNEGAATAFDTSRSIALHLQRSGYTTALFGKYLNGYRDLFPAVPQGWSEWQGFRDLAIDFFKPGSVHNNPILSSNGAPSQARGYSTDVLGDFAVDFIQRHAAEANPFFLLVGFTTPHIPLLPATRHAGAFAGRAPPAPASLDETDFSDKQDFVPATSSLSLAERASIWEEASTSTFEMLLGVDEAVGRILDALEQAGIEENTLVVFTSDNGMLYGEHGWVGKGVPYEASIRVPLVMRYPALTGGDGRRHTSDALVSHLDLAPTFAALAGIPFDADGRSLAPLLLAPRLPWRAAVAFEFEQTMGLALGYRGLRFRNFKWIAWENGQIETYDLRRDPDEVSGRMSEVPGPES